MEKQEKPEKSIEEIFEDLNQILEKLEDRNVTLQDSFQLYNDGMNLLKFCNEKIDEVEKKVLVIDDNGECNEF